MKKLIYVLIFLAFAGLANAQWSVVNMGTTNQFTDIELSNDQTFFATAVNNTTYDGTFYKSTNGGVNWFQLPLPTNFKAPYVCNFSSDGINGFVAGTQIIKTSNGGLNWTVAYTSDDTVVFFGADIEGTPKAFWAAGVKMSGSTMIPVVVRCPSFFTSNVYTRITMPSSMSGYQLTCIATIDSMSCLIGVQRGSQPGVILKTTNKGVNWSEFYTPNGIEIWAIDMSSGGSGFAAGGNGGNSYIYMTTNTGVTWNLVYSGTQGRIRGLDFYSQVFAVGLNGTILKGSGDGTIWSAQNSGVNNTLYAVSVLESNHDIAYVAGDNGTMLKTNNGGIGIQNISSEIPDKYSLSQNYPNPFNPLTKIRFAIPKNEIVTLKIYDLLGREAAILVNEKLQSGAYETTFDASSLPSGVYFYKLKTNTYSDTKKMILIK
ncbi:MAG: T9SS type A sorting domain-containing protein [Ignavibacteria bacterium]|nr:T9SS type A sorting domain-containing protein [Ignavibacteria bacterium]